MPPTFRPYQSVGQGLNRLNLPEGAEATEAQRTRTVLSRSLDRMSKFFFDKAEEQATIEGEKFGIENMSLQKLKDANKLLKRNWSIDGKVQKGKQLGKKIGFPTANIDINDYVLAKPGVYSVKVRKMNRSNYIIGIANLGYRPTFNGKKLLLEVNIFGIKKNLYNKNINVIFNKFIRPEKKFKNITELKNQITKDIKLAKKNV